MLDIFENDMVEDGNEETKPEIDFPDGVYFNMVEKTYFALERLSASAIKQGLISMPTLWVNSWMNKDKGEDEDKPHQVIGRAYHAAFFEPETLNDRYAGAPDLSSIEGLLTTDTAVKAELKEMGVAQSKAGENALERAYRLVDCGCEKPIKSIIEHEFKGSLGDRVPIDAETWAQIKIDIERVQSIPDMTKIINGGAAEVTILWTCQETGIKMKSRIDKLRLHDFTDLKSFANSNGKEINQAMADAIRYNRYYLSMRLYQIAIDEIWKQDLPIVGDATGDQKHLISNIKNLKRTKTPYFLFQEKGGAPNIYLRKFNLTKYPDGIDHQSIGAEDHVVKMVSSALAMKADIEIAEIKKRFLQCVELYGDDGAEWLPLDMIGDINDEDFSGFFLDELPQR